MVAKILATSVKTLLQLTITQLGVTGVRHGYMENTIKLTNFQTPPETTNSWYCIISTKTFVAFSNLNEEFISTWTRTVFKNNKRPNWEWPHNKTGSTSLSRGNKIAFLYWWQSKPFPHKHVFPRISLSWTTYINLA